MIYLGNAAEALTGRIHVVAFYATLLHTIYFPYFATIQPRTWTNISLLSFTVIKHCNRFWLQPLKMPENVSLLFTILFCFPHSRYVHLCKNEDRGTCEKKISLCLSDLQLTIMVKTWRGAGGGIVLLFLLFPERSREWTTPKTSHLLHANYHCLHLVKNILNIPHLGGKTPGRGYNCISALHADVKTWNYFSPIFSFPSHNQTQSGFSSSRWVQSLITQKNCIS